MIHYRQGDATAPVGDGGKVIVHCCNDQGGWGSGFVVALSRRWPQPEAHYRSMETRRLGMVGLVSVEPTVWVANIIGQSDYLRSGASHDIPPIRYEALRKGFRGLVKWIQGRDIDISVHTPRIGCGLAGGDWALIEPLILDTFLRHDIDVFVYDFPGGTYYDSRKEP